MGKIFEFTEKHLLTVDDHAVFVETGSDQFEGSTRFKNRLHHTKNML